MALDMLADRILDLEYKIDQQQESEIFVAQQESKKTGERFLDMGEEDCQAMIDAQKNSNTKKKTQTDLRMFKDFLVKKKENRKIEDIPAPELDKFLATFVISVRRFDENNELEEYEPDSISSKVNSVGRYLREKNYPYDIKTALEFEHSRMVLQAKRRELKSRGKGNKKNKAEAIETNKFELLRQKGLLGVDNAVMLQNAVWLVFTQQFGMRGITPHINMMWGDVELKVNAEGTEYLEFSERQTKTRSGKNRDVRPFCPKAFAKPGDPFCPVYVFKEFRRHRPETCQMPDSRMYLQPLAQPKTDIWFSRQPLGKNKLGSIVKDMYKEAGIVQGRHTNHSIRRGMIQSALTAGVHETKIMQLTGHKNITSLNDYRTISVAQQKEISHILTSNLSSSSCSAASAAQAIEANPQKSSSAAQAQVATHDDLSDDLWSELDVNLDSFALGPDVTTPRRPSCLTNCTFNGPVTLNLNYNK